MNPSTMKAVLPVRPGDVVELCSAHDGRTWRMGGYVQAVKAALVKVDGRWYPLANVRRVAP